MEGEGEDKKADGDEVTVYGDAFIHDNGGS